MNFKKILLTVSFVLLNQSCLLLYSNNETQFVNNNDHTLDSNLDLDDDFYSDIDFDDPDFFITTKQISLDPGLIRAIVEDIGITINSPLWKHTKPPKGRDVLYLIPNRLLAIEYGGIVTNLFFNYTEKMNFSPNETLKLDPNQETLDKIMEYLNDALSSKEASSLVPLFKKLTIQERRVGALVQTGFNAGPFVFQLNTSLQLSERNFWMSLKDQTRIEEIFEEFEGTFDNKEMYKIKYGLGDTRLKAGLNTLNMSNFQLDLGLEGILPTSKISSIPTIKEYNIDLDNFEDTIHNVLRSIRDHLITPRLGNGGHFGLGAYLETKLDLFHNTIHLWNRISFDNLFSAEEGRLIPSKVTIPAPGLSTEDPNPFIANIMEPLDDGNPEPATEFIKQYLFPPAYKVQVKPGGILNFVSSITFDLSKKLFLGIGYDFYLQQKETFGDIYTKHVDKSSLAIKDAESDQTNQHKIFAEINYLKKQKHGDLNLGFGGDYTISSKHIGHDWTIFIRLGSSF